MASSNGPGSPSRDASFEFNGVGPMGSAEKIHNIIHERQKVTIDLLDRGGNWIGYLAPITQSTVADSQIIEKLVVWRNQARKYFMTQFSATYARTKAWLENTVLRENNRLLFLIHSPTLLIGHLGFKGLTTRSAELDNLIRGEKGGHPQIIYHAEWALVNWLYGNFSIDEICAHVLADNFITLRLHQSIGFRPTQRIPVLRKIHGEEIHLEMCAPGGWSMDGIYSQRLELTRLEFVRRKEEEHD
jgi:hypothetical protein